MRVLAVTNLYPNPFQPQRATFNRRQFRSLASRHDLHVISPIFWTDELAARCSGKAPLPRGRRVILDGLTVDHPRYLFPPRVLRRSHGICYRWSIRRTFWRAVEEFRPDLVYATCATPDGWAATRLGREARLPVVLKVHGSDILVLANTPDRRAGIIAALRQAERVIAVSQDLASRVIELGAEPQRVQVIYNGVDSAVFHPGPQAEARTRLGLDRAEPVLLFVGNLLPVKGLEILVEACAGLARQGIPFHGHLIGQGPLKSSVERHIRDSGLEGRMTLHGSLPQEQLADWYRAASVLALSSHSEGVPNVLLEAAACGTPFVASRVGGIPEIAHLGVSRLVPPGDPLSLAAALEQFLTADGRRPVAERPSVRGQAEEVSELTALFEETLEEHSRARSVRPVAVS